MRISKNQRRRNRAYVKRVKRELQAWQERDHPHSRCLDAFRRTFTAAYCKAEMMLAWGDEWDVGPFFGMWDLSNYESDEWELYPFDIFDMIMQDRYFRDTGIDCFSVEGSDWQDYLNWTGDILKKGFSMVAYLESFPKKHKMDKDFKHALNSMCRRDWSERWL